MSVIVEEARENRRRRALKILADSPGSERGVFVDDFSDKHSVILAVAFRKIGATCELAIPRDRYNPMKLLEMIEKHSHGVSNV